MKEVPDYKPSDKDQKLIKRTQSMFDMSHKARLNTTKVWRESEELYMGEHWKGNNMPGFKNQLTLDLIASSIDTMVPILSNRPPRIDVIAMGGDESVRGAAELLQKQIDELWIIRDMHNLIPDFLLDYLVYGNGIMKISYNNEDDLPDADVVDPFAFYVNPSATKLENAEYVAYAAPAPLWEIRKNFENGKYVRSQGDLDKYEALKINDVNVGGSDITQVTDTKGQETNYHSSTSEAMESLEERALVVECYSRNYDKSTYMDEGELKFSDDDMYPGNVRQTTICNGVLLYDGPTKYPFLTKENHVAHPFPFVVLKNGGSAHSFWGKPEPKRLKSINLSLDRIASQLMDNIALMANPLWVVDETCDVVNQINNKPGSIVRKRGPGQVNMVQPASMPTYVFNFYNLLIEMFETISGVNRATQGKADPNVTSGIQAQIYRNASTTKIDFKSRSVDQAIQTLGTMWIAMIRNLGTQEHSLMMGTDDGLHEQKYVGIMMKDMDMTIRAKAGSMLPENREWIEAKLLQLVQMGILTDPMYLIENMEIPGKERLLQAMQDQNAVMNSEMSDEEITDLGTDEDAIMSKLQQDPNMLSRLPNNLS